MPFTVAGPEDYSATNYAWRLIDCNETGLVHMTIAVFGTVKNAKWVCDSLNSTLQNEEEAFERGG